MPEVPNLKYYLRRFAGTPVLVIENGAEVPEGTPDGTVIIEKDA